MASTTHPEAKEKHNSTCNGRVLLYTSSYAAPRHFLCLMPVWWPELPGASTIGTVRHNAGQTSKGAWPEHSILWREDQVAWRAETRGLSGQTRSIHEECNGAIRAWPGPGDHIITASCGHGTTVVTVDDRLVERKIGNAFHVIWIGVDSGNFFGRGGRPSR